MPYPDDFLKYFEHIGKDTLGGFTLTVSFLLIKNGSMICLTSNNKHGMIIKDIITARFSAGRFT